jgi:radical SAM protein with 4Fe4S-binding SPASM domain
LKAERSKMIGLTRFSNFLKIIAGYIISRLIHGVIHWGQPLAVSIEPTNHCQLSCPECPSGTSGLTRKRGYINPDLFRSIIDQLSPHLSYLTLYFQGEPFLDPHLFESIQYARSKKIYVSTSTNAHFLFRENSEKIIKSGLSRLIISLDGTDQETYASYRRGGSFEKVTVGIRILTEIKKQLNSSTPFIIIQFLVLKTNQHQIRDIRILGKQLGADKVELKTAQFYDYQYGHPLMPDIPKYSRYRLIDSLNHHLANSPTHQLKNHFPNACFRMWSGCVFTWDGMIVPCCFDKDAQYVLGNIQNQSFRQIWRNQAYHEFRKKILKNRKSIDICTNCSQTF